MGKEYNILSVMKDMGKNMMNGAPALKWPTWMPLTGGKKKTGQRSETHSNFSSGEGCKSANPDLQQYAYSYCHHTHSQHQYNHPHIWTPSHMQLTPIWPPAHPPLAPLPTATAISHVANPAVVWQKEQSSCEIHWLWSACCKVLSKSDLRIRLWSVDQMSC